MTFDAPLASYKSLLEANPGKARRIDVDCYAVIQDGILCGVYCDLDGQVDRASVYGLLLIASPFSLAPAPTAHVYSASKYSIVSMQGHDGLFARQLPIASTCFAHLDI